MLKILVTALFLFSITACVSNSKKQDIEDIVVETAEEAPVEAQENTGHEVQDETAVAVEETSSNIELNGDSDSMRAGEIQTVYFGYDSANLDSSVISKLEANAEYLKDHPSVEVQIEGHCDERGGIQYNLALGEKRAKAVKQYLEALGVESSRMSTMSYGKERPKAFGHDEAAWSQNRRANFVIMNK